MAKLLALEWDANEARIVLARTRGSEIVVEHAMSVDLSPHDDAEQVEVGQRIAAALTAHGAPRAETLVAVGRTRVELRQLSLPLAPLEELPDLVRFQSTREFSSIDESWPIDFTMLASGKDDVIQVLAAAISPQSIEQLQQVCQVGGLTPTRIVLRPFAAAALMKRQNAGGGGCCLLVDLLADEADLTVLIDREVAVVRTVRRPAENEPDQQTSILLGEIRRTMLASQNQLGNRRIEQIILWGNENNHRRLQRQLADELELDVALFNPFDEFTLDAKIASRPVEYPGRYAPLLGMLHEEAIGQGHAIDFLNPRKTVEPPNQRRRLAFIGVAATAVLLLLLGTVWEISWSKNTEIRRLQAESFELEDGVKRAEKRRAEVAEIEKFLAADINWLDELRELSEEFPASEKAILTQLNASARTEEGKLILEGYAINYSTINAIESSLRDGRHRVSGHGGKEDDARKTYRWLFNESILVEKQKPINQESSATRAGKRSE